MTACPGDNRPQSEWPNWDAIDFVPYFGVGWGQTQSQIPAHAQFARRIYNLDGVAVSTRLPGHYLPGYVVGKRGIQFGLQANDQCSYMRLDVNSYNSDDWARPAGCIAVNGGTCYQGEILMDTGDERFIPTFGTPYSYPTAGVGAGSYSSAYFSGTVITVSFGGVMPAGAGSAKVWVAAGPAAAAPANSGIISPPNVIEPQIVKMSSSSYASFLNTGRSFYNYFDMCFELNSGQFGIRESKALPWPGN